MKLLAPSLLGGEKRAQRETLIEESHAAKLMSTHVNALSLDLWATRAARDVGQLGLLARPDGAHHAVQGHSRSTKSKLG